VIVERGCEGHEPAPPGAVVLRVTACAEKTHPEAA
jgi:hypothetical protein